MTMKSVLLRSKLLGEQTAENDKSNLLLNFIETPEYRSVIENKDCSVVVGRRGTGKSAMFFKLQELWGKEKCSYVISISPEDYQTIKFTSFFKFFQNNYSLSRAASKLIWKYGFYMEIISVFSTSFKTKELVERNIEISEVINSWKGSYTDFFGRLSSKLNQLSFNNKKSEDIVSELNENSKFHLVEDFIFNILSGNNFNFYILIDRLDEGYENNEIGLAIISGIIAAASETNKKFDKVRVVIFQRDNIIRSIAKHDPDYTRNIEGEIIRIHWDTYQLFNLITKRLNTAFTLGLENSKKIWDRCTANEDTQKELQGQEGFKKCLQFTLYRPRDLLSLLNQAFYNAARENRGIIILSDIEKSAKNISLTRLDDLKKEYGFIVPSILFSTGIFVNQSPEFKYIDAINLIDSFISSISSGRFKENELISQLVAQDFILLGSDGVLRSLYSVGFIGTHDKTSNIFTFCHDGRNPDREFSQSDRLLIHPCYWIALNLSKNALEPNEAEQINDEYEIKVTSVTPELRAQKIGMLISEIGNITEGRDCANDFESWLKTAVEIVFAGHLGNIQIHPNGVAVQRRDIVGTNLCLTPAWKRINKDYDVRQVVFDAKNYKEIGASEYRQLSTYLHDQYGSLGFVVTRDEDDSLRKGKDLDWTKEMFDTQRKVIVKLSYKFFIRLLSKLRSPNSKHDIVDEAISKLLDTYERQYLSNQSTRATNIKSRSK
ncbi:MAG: ATP-binding protein [Methylobacter sp.]|nr:ATP-binding protein [Methylobacter sp.]MDP2100751.1 ATP-binding protein [Methylobacter sp.]MDP2429893.1 ATP-binding protein [Methylobacter sp.]MDP3056080.1 ATP-binding protein [Methylobacter sp.]MDP3362850.1 ATP-binding protein [Methylobacter sp.]